MANWILKQPSVNIKLMSETLNISETLATVLANRDIKTKNTAIKFLNPRLKYLHDSFLLGGMEKSIKILMDASSFCEKIVIYGDYDADGIMSTVILYKTLKAYGADVTYYIPLREEGYGLNKPRIKSLHDEGVELILTCDNGISATNEVDYAKELGMKVVIIDHHEPPLDGDLPSAHAIIDPKCSACTYPYKNLCAGGLAYKFSDAFHQSAELDYNMHDEFLVLAMIATFCDIVDLNDENRILAKNGLDMLNKNKEINLGLKALMDVKKISAKELTGYDIGFIVGPCINASGRLDVATLAVKLLLTEDADEATQLALKLSELNDERKGITTKAVTKVMEGLTDNEIKDSVLVIYEPDIHESIAGIVAGRLKDTLYHPTIVLTKNEGMVKGSARSIEGYDIFKELSACKDLFERFGGHAMAAGLSLKEENIGELRRRLNEACTLNEDDFVETINIDKELFLDEITYELVKDLNVLEPFGKENRVPYFVTRGVKITQIDFLGENKKTLRLTIELEETGRKIKAICFNKYELLEKILSEKYSESACLSILSSGKNLYLRFDIVYSIGINEYNNNVSVEIRVKDFRHS